MKEKILEELKAIAFAKATDYVSVTGEQLTVADTGALAPEAGAAIASIERSSTGLKVKFYDKLKALELLGKCCGLFENGEEPQDNGVLAAVLAATGEEQSHGLSDPQ